MTAQMIMTMKISDITHQYHPDLFPQPGSRQTNGWLMGTDNLSHRSE